MSTVSLDGQRRQSAWRSESVRTAVRSRNPRRPSPCGNTGTTLGIRRGGKTSLGYSCLAAESPLGDRLNGYTVVDDARNRLPWRLGRALFMV